MRHTLTLSSIDPVTHDTNRLVFNRPDGFEFSPGQATDLALDRDGWRDEKRPFTFTCLPDAPHLEFVIKSNPDRDGVTKRIAELSPGDTVTIGDAWGAIEDRGPGVFVAGGAGITPFIAILRNRLDREGTLDGSTLLFSNAAERDIILREEWEAMPGLRTVFPVTEETAEHLPNRQIDGSFLDDAVGDFSGVFYLCGPPGMVDDVSDALRRRSVPEERIVTED